MEKLNAQKTDNEIKSIKQEAALNNKTTKYLLNVITARRYKSSMG